MLNRIMLVMLVFIVSSCTADSLDPKTSADRADMEATSAANNNPWQIAIIENRVADYKDNAKAINGKYKLLLLKHK